MFSVVVFLDKLCPIVLDACFELLTWIFFLSNWVYEQAYNITCFLDIHRMLCLRIICSKTPICLSLLISPERKKGRNGVLKFFHRDWRRCTKSYPRMVKTISLGMWRKPYLTYTLSVCTRPTSVFWLKHLINKTWSVCLFVLV